MSTQPSPLQWSRDPDRDLDRLPSNFVVSFIGHALLCASLVGVPLLLHKHGESWGEHVSTAGAIQASMVSSIPLPPRQKTLDTGVLTSEKPSPAPTPPTPPPEPPPKPNEGEIPEKGKVNPKVAGVPAPAPPKRPQPVQPPPTKAITGETSGIRIPQATMQLRNGTASVSVQDSTFGARFAYYVNIVNRTVAQNWYTQEADPTTSTGKRVTIVFDINREGVPSNPRFSARSGSPTLDTSAMRALQRVEGFGPLPQGDHITVEYSFDYRPQ